MSGARPATLPAIPLTGIRPRLRRRESVLIALVAAALVVGSVSLSATVQVAAGGPLSISIADPGNLAVYLAVLVGVHLAQILAGRRTDQVLLPAVGMLGGISLLLMERLPQDLVTQTIGGQSFGLAQVQLAWLVLALVIVGTLAIVVRSDSWLRLYKYTWAAAGICLLILTVAFGVDVNGARLSLRLGPISGQPSELLKVILVIFLAGYLSENRSLLIEQDTRIGRLRLPPLPYLAPMLAMWAVALAVVIVQRDLGAALLFFLVFLLLLYIATGRTSTLVIGIVLFIVGGLLLYSTVDT
ncbi:MAG: FtsW/RodA/SpoVE family cell cycle protein, partial [Candidatus Limnocylindrales bacterium]